MDCHVEHIDARKRVKSRGNHDSGDMIYWDSIATISPLVTPASRSWLATSPVASSIWQYANRLSGVLYSINVLSGQVMEG